MATAWPSLKEAKIGEATIKYYEPSQSTIYQETCRCPTAEATESQPIKDILLYHLCQKVRSCLTYLTLYYILWQLVLNQTWFIALATVTNLLWRRLAGLRISQGTGFQCLRK